SDADLKTGFGGELVLAYRFMPHLGAYAGWGWNKFNAKQSFMGADTDFEETGYVLGLQFIHPIGESKFSYVLRGGAIYKHIESENAEGKIMADTGHGWGWQGDIGLSIGLGENSN
ncbi:MAG: opacity protein, partial [Scytonema sp. CRU_2_7]|nr:opacity protein [Scytonema sp. CRU_2_7]